MSKILSRINSFFLLGTIFFCGVYFAYKFKGMELIGFLYVGIVFLIALITTSVMLIMKKRKSTDENKQA
ncbi:hypothetical protein HOO54_14410 [Bacillus sp. WMMC1349]|uniref:hypothetical protein n=1 Tax=Bacillus sp. WMMC1349 TaxID=2736254 RepID=UPI001556AEEB|nr:hypothetical protein [Bacillus sp. WMMC1349]NPC93397.1 hypothetical protein [Bacillus sp. WMMC1349]